MRRTLLIFLVLAAGLSARAAGVPVERIYVSTDRTVYIAGDAVWCSLFCMDGKGAYSNQSAVAYLELISMDGTAATAKIGLLEGRGAGSFRIPVTAPTGTYRLVAYTAVNAGEEGTPWQAGSRLISVFNSTSTARVGNGVELMDSGSYERLEKPAAAKEGSLGLSMGTRQRRGANVALTIHNEGAASDVSLSIVLDDDLVQPAQENSPASFLKALPGSVQLKPGARSIPEYDGEVVSARVRGTRIEDPEDEAVATLSSAGAPSNLYIGRTEGDDRVSFYTSNIYGDREIVCEVSQLDRREGYIDFESPFVHPYTGVLPKLVLSPAQKESLSARKASLRSEKELRIDTLTNFMTHRKDLLLEGINCRRYHLDDYTRFPSVKEIMVELIHELRLKQNRKSGWAIELQYSDAANARNYRSENVLVMMDGVVLSNLDNLVAFDAMLLEDIDIYAQSFACGRLVYHGLVNFITKKNYVTALHFPANVRVLDFQGVSYPVAYNGAVPAGEGPDLRQLLYWNPVLKLDAESDYRLEFHAPGYAGRFKVVAEGFSADGKPVRQELSFEVE